MDVELILLAMSPLFLLFVGSEFLYWRRRGRGEYYSLADSLCNATLALLHQGADKLAWFLTLPLFSWLAERHHLFAMAPGWQSALALFLLQDFLYYWFHRASHRVRWFWAAHSVHHSSTRMNFSTAFRQSLMYPVAGMWLFWLPLAWVGFPPQSIIAVVLLNLAYQFFVHTRLCRRLGVLEYVFNTPRIHRCHHAKNPVYLDKNYAGVLVIWDRLFGTYVDERDDEPCQFGTVKPVTSFNPLRVTFWEWRDMLNDLVTARGWRHKLMMLLAPPERVEALIAARNDTK
ncbi:sterol desaturase family protein [Paludibacterium purpuratum]|uniref:Sterol desaturase/sphingolipid hydroxylase (Fatty acid hydroxylase superfamily) n=1 Tax=Paludibacterium purpuratum TaxID=1144873 RepID=A0A4V3DUV9_9NEIS|nr:sterol desaturase family protein [Paludibacterium purpuratum]TDR76547.1 sterol desaturase/sphingolipid hydroxylase (fatty acid hydroxylase superfamily) [Paludibacterium purpuratum]